MKPGKAGYSPFKIHNGVITILKSGKDTPYEDMFNMINTEECCMLHNLDKDVKFFYELTIYDREYIEWGVGHIEKHKFIRDTILQTKIGDRLLPSRNREPHALDNGFGIVTCNIPDDYRQLMTVSANSILASSKNGTPFPLELLDNTVVGNIDGDVDAVDGKGIAGLLVEHVSWLLSKLTGTVKLHMKILEIVNKAAVLITPQVRFTPRSRPRKAQPGTVIYNSQTKSLEVRTEEGWKTL